MEIIEVRKKVKKMTLRIKKDGRVILTVPLSSSRKSINDFLSQSKEWLDKNYTKSIEKTII